MWNQRPSYRFEIDNFSKKESYITSQTFVSGGCEWFLYVYPKGDHRADNHLSLYLHVANPTLLPTGWKRSAKFYFVVLNQSDKELCRTSIGQASTLFCAKALSGSFPKTLPLSKLKEKGILENDKLIIEVYINVLEAVDGEVEDVSEKKETVDINGFQVFASQVRKKFAEHVVKAEYKNVLSNACTKLSELAEEGFKLDWLKSKLDELSLKKKKKANDVDDGSRVQLLEERIKNLEVLESGSKMDCLKSKLEEISLERKKPHDAYESCVQKLDERVKNLELMELGFKIDSLKTKLDEVTLEMNKSDDDDDSDDGDDDSDDESWAEQLEERVTNLELMESNLKLESLKAELDEVSLERKKENSRAQQFEKRIKDLELMMARLTVELGFKVECLKSKFEEDSLERKISYDADGSRIWESIEDLAMIVSELKVELDKKKDKSSADGFMLVD